MNGERSLFISFEGIEGAGKSTQMSRLGEYLRSRGRDVILTREPGGTIFGERIRDIFLDPALAPFEADEELLLVYAARMRHLRECILPALNQGSMVFCDRYEDSTFAYQGGGRQMPLARLDALSAWLGPLQQPDLTFWFDVDPRRGLARAGKRGRTDRLEQETLAFFERARQIFLQRWERFPERILRINANEDLEIVWESLLAHAAERIVS